MDNKSTEIKSRNNETSINVGRQFYGETFTNFMRIGEINDLLPAFKDFYYQAKIKKSDTRLADILQNFNKEFCAPQNRKFHPYTAQIKIWRNKWDLDLMQQMQNKDLEIAKSKNIYQIIKTRDEQNNLALNQIGDNDLEAGVKTLGGELLNDAMQMLRDDQKLEDIYSNDELIKRRSYIVNVFAHATRLVHGKAALMLKASEEKRNTAGFLMNLLSRATSGKMTDEEIGLLKSAYTPKQNEQSQ